MKERTYIDTFEESPSSSLSLENLRDIPRLIQENILSVDEPTDSELYALAKFLKRFYPNVGDIPYIESEGSDFERLVEWLNHYVTGFQNITFWILNLNRLKDYLDSHVKEGFLRATMQLDPALLIASTQEDTNNGTNIVLDWDANIGFSYDVFESIHSLPTGSYEEIKKLTRFVNVNHGVTNDFDIHLLMAIKNNDINILRYIEKSLRKNFENVAVEIFWKLQKRLSEKTPIYLNEESYSLLSLLIGKGLELIGVNLFETADGEDNILFKELYEVCCVDIEYRRHLIDKCEGVLWKLKEKKPVESINELPSELEQLLRLVKKGYNVCLPIDMKNELIYEGLDSNPIIPPTNQSEVRSRYRNLNRADKVSFLEFIKENNVYYEDKSLIPEFMKVYSSRIAKSCMEISQTDQNRLTSIGMNLDVKISIIENYIRDILAPRSYRINKTGHNQFEVVMDDTYHGMDGELVFYYILGDNNLPYFVRDDVNRVENNMYSVMPLIYFRAKGSYPVMISRGLIQSIDATRRLAKKNR